MRKTIATLAILALMVIALPFAANAQCRRGNCRRYYRTSRSYVAAPTRYYVQRQRPSFYRRHRNLINIGIASGAGALIGGVAGGRRGAFIGMASGAGLGALYTYVLKAKKRRY